MGMIELFLVAVGLSMDAFSVSVCGSLALRPAFRLREAIRFGAWFGGFQLLMPVIGYWAAYRVRSYIESFDHWIAFFLLLYIGINMIREAGEECPVNMESYSFSRMALLALATSIDALAVGVSFAFLDINIWHSAVLIGLVTFVFSFFGGLLGFKLGENSGGYAFKAGGSILCLIGLKILLEHTGYL